MSNSPLHSKQGPGNGGVHVPYNWTYADETARTSASGFTADDIGKLSLQQDNNTLWILTATTPTWSAIATGTAIAHSLGGASHTADTLANLNAKISDATLDDSSSSRPPSGAAGGGLTGTYPNPTVSGLTSGILSDDTAHGNRGGAALHSAATTSVNGFMSSADKTKLDGVATSATNTPLTASSPANVTKAAAVVGSATDAARADHKHDITTATASANNPGASSTEGSATSLARSDHTHALHPYGTTANTICQGNDSRLSDDRIASGLRTASGVVSISGADAPASGLILKATSSTTATWQADSGGVATQDQPSVQARRSTTYATTSTFTDITLDVTDHECDSTIIDHDLGTSDRILLKEVGTYLITYSFDIGDLNAATSTLDIEAHITLNDGAMIAGSHSVAGIFRDGSIAGEHHHNSQTAAFVYDNTSASNFISLQIKHTVLGGTATSAEIKADAIVTVTRLRGTKGDKGDTGATGAGSNVTVKDEGTSVTGTPHSALNFVGAGVTVTDAGGGQATITIPGTATQDTFQATATASTTTTSSTDVVVTNMTLTPGAGTYLVMYSSSFKCNQLNKYIYASIYVNGAKQAHTERISFQEGSVAPMEVPVAMQTIATVSAGQAIDVRWRTENNAPPNTGTMYQRTLTLVKIG